MNGTSFDTPGISGGVSIVEIQEFLDFFCDSGTALEDFFTLMKLLPDVTFTDY